MIQDDESLLQAGQHTREPDLRPGATATGSRKRDIYELNEREEEDVRSLKRVRLVSKGKRAGKSVRFPHGTVDVETLQRHQDLDNVMDLFGSLNGRFTHLRAQVDRFHAQANKETVEQEMQGGGEFSLERHGKLMDSLNARRDRKERARMENQSDIRITRQEPWKENPIRSKSGLTWKPQIIREKRPQDYPIIHARLHSQDMVDTSDDEDEDL